MKTSLPEHYSKNKEAFPEYFEALENLGNTLRKISPLPEKTMCLINLAAAAAIQSEGAVHSHTRRAIESGISAEEIRHSILLITSTIGFPKSMAALSWVNDLFPEKKTKKSSKAKKDKKK